MFRYSHTTGIYKFSYYINHFIHTLKILRVQEHIHFQLYKIPFISVLFIFFIMYTSFFKFSSRLCTLVDTLHKYFLEEQSSWFISCITFPFTNISYLLLSTFFLFVRFIPLLLFFLPFILDTDVMYYLSNNMHFKGYDLPMSTF